MNRIKIIALLSLITSQLVMAIVPGSLDETFSNDGVTDGWHLTGSNGLNYRSQDVKVDSQSRVLVAGTFQSGANPDNNLSVTRYLKDGTVDTTFATNGIYSNGLDNNFSSIKIVIDDKDGVFIGYSADFPSQTGPTIDTQIHLIHLDSSGSFIDFLRYGYDTGSTPDRYDDTFADFLYYPRSSETGTLMVLAEVERTGSEDTDFALTRLNINTAGLLSPDTGFGSNSNVFCFFDQSTLNGASGDIDIAQSIVRDVSTGNYIIGGSSFEGDGIDSNGWNLSFCEYDIVGNLLRKWSTQSNQVLLDSREELVDLKIAYDNNSNPYLIALSKEPESINATKRDFVLRKYIRTNTDSWILDTSFANNGIVTYGYTVPFSVDTTDDVAAGLVIEKNGSILVAGTSGWDNNNDFNYLVTVVKYKSDGTLDAWGPALGGSNHLIFNITELGDICNAITLDTTLDKIYIAGSSFSFDNLGYYSLIARLVNDLIFKSGFD